MGLPTEKLGAKFETRPEVIDGERAKAYARATNDENPAYASGKLAPPVYGAIPTWQAMVAAMEGVIPAEAKEMVVHAERDMHFHRPLTPGMKLSSVSDAFSWRVGGSGTRYTLRILSHSEGQLVLEQYCTMFIRKMSDGANQGPEKPDHNFPEAARSKPAGQHTVRVDPDQTYRYRDASGDDMRIHIDDAFAKSIGLPGIILHGVCTMAMAGQSAIETVGGHDPAKLRRLAVRWAKPALPAHNLVSSFFDVGPVGKHHAYAFETTSNGVAVITNGWAEIG
jgi:acyl dehydratase